MAKAGAATKVAAKAASTKDLRLAVNDVENLSVP